ncbi:NERD domain-containing protein [Mobilicoccus sp.]|uniref:NERD domain-containing protein n=1 Tax=Mobilicoccus sp. TaxID=2034349 RepID=UPI0028A9B3A1|nr:NERD domain-containing protein [Mobilicoccus sp.]
MIIVPALKDIESNSLSSAETRLAQLLHRIDGPDDAVAFHSVKLRSHRFKQQAEVDFVVFWKGVVFLVEVKGGGVRKYDGKWYSVDRREDWHELRESPMEQARGGMYALKTILREDGLGWFAAEAVVFTPDIDSPPPSVEWDSSHWWAREAATVHGLTEALDRVAEAAPQTPPKVPVASARQLRDRLYGEFTRLPVVDVHRGAVLEEQVIATQGQARVLAGLAVNPRLLVYGGAGTGKSLILAEAAREEAQRGRSVLITYRSPELTRFFGSLVQGFGIDLTPFAELAEGTSYDVVFVDEAQDLMNAEGMDAFDNAVKGGRAAGRWRMFLDPNNQARVDGEFDPDVHELVSSEGALFSLGTNVRNTKAIVHVVQEYLGADVGDPGIVAGEAVNWVTIGDAADPLGAAESKAVDLAAQGVRKRDIWIIDVGSTASPYTSPRGVTITSPRYAKGLEAEHVVVCGLPGEYDDRSIAAFYVAVTRARVALHILVSKADKRALMTLLKPLEKR